MTGDLRKMGNDDLPLRPHRRLVGAIEMKPTRPPCDLKGCDDLASFSQGAGRARRYWCEGHGGPTKYPKAWRGALVKP